ncbi:MAG: hypothetical protein ACI39R_06950 [Lachnospiraceae bacterium]
MKKMFKVLMYVLSAVFILLILLVIILIYLSKKPAIPKNYYEKQETGGSIEEKYAKAGEYTVSSKEYDAGTENNKQRHFKVWYPTEKGRYPLIVMVNGTGIPYQKYEEIFEHLAGWGFVVIGNDYETSWDGYSAELSLEFALENEEISGMIDKEKIGIGGHSQGGEGTFNAVTQQKNGELYKVLFSLSPTNNDLAVALEWGYELGTENAYGYDLSKITIPTLMLAGTEKFDAETVIPLEQLQKNFESLPDNIPKVAARRSNTEHGDMLWRSDAYVTAWLRYWFYNDEEAGKAFFGPDAELNNNQYWQDYMSSGCQTRKR